MLEDVNTGIRWAQHNCQHFGGDPSQLYICGQSAGSQLGLLALLKQVLIHAWCRCRVFLFVLSLATLFTLVAVSAGLTFANQRQLARSV